MTAQETNVTNSAQTTLSSSLGSGSTTLNVTDTTGFPSVPFYAVIDPSNDAKREVVLVDSAKTATTLVLTSSSKRGQDNTADVAHDSGAVVAVVPVAALWTDINDRVDAVETTADAAYTPGGTDVAVADGGTGASTAAGARTNLGLVIGTDVQAYSSVLANTTASFTTADETKLDGIEAGADVTDATNVDAAGAVMNSDTSTASMSFVIDEDNMASDSATKVPTQQSVKAYVDASGGGGGQVSAVKTADESVSSSSTLQDDDHLTVALGASKTYRFQLVIASGSSASYLKFAVAYTGTTSSDAYGWSFTNGSSVAAGRSTVGASVSMSSAGTEEHLIVTGYVTTSTAGNLKFQWAQVTPNATAKNVYKGSTLIAQEV